MLTRLKSLTFSLFLGSILVNFPAYGHEKDVLDVASTPHYATLKARENPRLAMTSGILEEQYKLIEGAELKPWAVALFAGRDIFSKGIRWLTESEWSHVGLVFEDQKSVKYCLESTGSANEILYQGMLPQVQIHKWDDVVSNYGGRVAYRQINYNEKKDIDPVATTKMVKDLIGTPYEESLTTLIESITRKNKEETPSSLFCSEMVAKVLIDMGYLSHERLADNYLPKDFSSKEFIPLKGISLETEIIVKEIKKNRMCPCIIF